MIDQLIQLELQQDNEPHAHPLLADAQRNVSGITRIQPGQANCAACMGRGISRTATWWLVPPDDPNNACGECDDHALSLVLSHRRGSRGVASMSVPRSRRQAWR